MEQFSREELKSHILGTASDLMSNFLYYDRKGDECLHVSQIEDAILDGVVAIDEIIATFKDVIVKSVITRREQRNEQKQKQSQGEQVR